MKEIKVRFSVEDIAALDAAAAAMQCSRAEVIRRRALTIATGKLDVQRYHKLVADAQCFMRGAMERRQVETLTAFVVSKLGATGDRG